MKKVTFLLVILLYITSQNVLYSQILTSEETPHIEMIGTADMEVMPNEIYIQVTLKERMKRGEKITIEEQESKMFEQLKAQGISNENIMLSDAVLGYVRVKVFKKDVIATKEYMVKARSAAEVKKVMDVLETNKIKDAFIAKVTHSKLKEFQKELRIKAIKDAKDKAEYLLEAIGYKLGLPMKVTEYFNESLRGTVAGLSLGYESKSSSKYDKAYNDIEYKKLKLEASVYVKFQIQ